MLATTIGVSILLIVALSIVGPPARALAEKNRTRLYESAF